MIHWRRMFSSMHFQDISGDLLTSNHLTPNNWKHESNYLIISTLGDILPYHRHCLSTLSQLKQIWIVFSQTCSKKAYCENQDISRYIELQITKLKTFPDLYLYNFTTDTQLTEKEI